MSDIAERARALLGGLVGTHEDLNREGLKQTPARMAKALVQLTEGYGQDLGELLTTFPADGYDEIVVLKNIPFASICEHHVLPFTGMVAVAYLPNERIIGLSKIPRLVRAVSRRLQVQEKMTKQIGEALMKHLKPRGVGVIVEAVHTCMTLRGVEGAGSMVTSMMLGFFRDDDKARAEVMRLMGRG